MLLIHQKIRQSVDYDNELLVLYINYSKLYKLLSEPSKDVKKDHQKLKMRFSQKLRRIRKN